MKKMLLIVFSLFISISIADEFVESKTTLGGYGELHYDMEANDGNGNLDFHRFILFVKHTFNDKWSMMSEIEIEHNMVYSSGDGGYLAMEQAYLNYWGGNWGFKGGVLLVPAGITNEYHEPPTFMSVERPEYNKYIIPTTWFDNGFAFYGKVGSLDWNFTMVGDMLGNKISPEKGLRSARLKGVSTTTTDWLKTIQLSWSGMDGLKLGGSMTMHDAPVWGLNIDPETGDEIEGDYNYADQISTIGFNLMEVNATYSKNNIYTRFEYGQVDYSGDMDITSSGYYLDFGYNIADMVGCDDSDLFVWLRNSAYNVADMGDDTEISLLGVTFKPRNNVSVKFEAGSKTVGDADSDIMRMGLGYMF